jgi:hypothetical protein
VKETLTCNLLILGASVAPISIFRHRRASLNTFVRTFGLRIMSADFISDPGIFVNRCRAEEKDFTGRKTGPAGEFTANAVPVNLLSQTGEGAGGQDSIG